MNLIHPRFNVLVSHVTDCEFGRDTAFKKPIK